MADAGFVKLRNCDRPRRPHRRFALFRRRSGRERGGTVEILDPIFESEPLEHRNQVFSAGRVILGIVQIAQEIVNDRQLAAGGRTVSNPIAIAGLSKGAAAARCRA